MMRPIDLEIMILTIEQARAMYPDAIIYEGAIIDESAVIGKGAEICEGARICRGAEICESAVIGKGAEICEGAVIGKGAEICEGAVIGKGAEICEGARICRGARVKSAIVITSIGETKNITGIECVNGELLIGIGCMNDYRGLPLDETRKEVSKKYPPEHIYFDALNLIEKWFKTRGLK